MLTIRTSQLETLRRGLNLDTPVIECLELLVEHEVDEPHLLTTEFEIEELEEPLLDTELVIPAPASRSRASGSRASDVAGESDSDFDLETEMAVAEDEAPLLDTELEVLPPGSRSRASESAGMSPLADDSDSRQQAGSATEPDYDLDYELETEMSIAEDEDCVLDTELILVG